MSDVEALDESVVRSVAASTVIRPLTTAVPLRAAMAIVGRPPPVTPPGPTATGAALETAAGGAVGTAAAATDGSRMRHADQDGRQRDAEDDADGDAEARGCPPAWVMRRPMIRRTPQAGHLAVPWDSGRGADGAVEDAGVGLADRRVQRLRALDAVGCPCRAAG